MLAIERQNLIYKELQDKKKVIVSELTKQFSVSDQTIRRDLEKLQRDGNAIVTYGGAVINDSLTLDLPFEVRKARHVLEKKKIAALAASYVNDGDTIILDASSTAVFVAKELKNKKGLTVATNSLEVIWELMGAKGCRIIGSGGEVDGDYLAFSGKNAVKTFDHYNCAKLIFSCKGIHAQKGISEGTDSISEIKLAMMQAADTKILAADSSKFGIAALSKIAELDALDIIVTDTHPGAEWEQILQSKHIEMLY